MLRFQIQSGRAAPATLGLFVQDAEHRIGQNEEQSAGLDAAVCARNGDTPIGRAVLVELIVDAGPRIACIWRIIRSR